LAFAEKAGLDQWLISFPAGFAKLHVTDLGIIGNLAFILILFWTFFAIRRENMAVETFVKTDIDDKNGFLVPSEFDLIPQGDLFSAAHFAYAFQVVSQRFLFIIRTNSRPLLVTTVTLCAFPAAVSLLDLLIDLLDLHDHSFESTVWVQIMVGVVLSAAVCADRQNRDVHRQNERPT